MTNLLGVKNFTPGLAGEWFNGDTTFKAVVWRDKHEKETIPALAEIELSEAERNVFK
ncbi:hypothetical protein ACFOGI_10195 [Virgibacillus xinjiangensis]|uniref:Uncharacterized protein n=1 Tax=Virgibacillus xinjiangensis TaxID=393090 RepID=A0ABV7CVX4_9BACI